MCWCVYLFIWWLTNLDGWNHLVSLVVEGNTISLTFKKKHLECHKLILIMWQLVFLLNLVLLNALLLQSYNWYQKCLLLELWSIPLKRQPSWDCRFLSSSKLTNHMLWLANQGNIVNGFGVMQYKTKSMDPWAHQGKTSRTEYCSIITWNKASDEMHLTLHSLMGGGVDMLQQWLIQPRLSTLRWIRESHLHYGSLALCYNQRIHIKIAWL